MELATHIIYNSDMGAGTKVFWSNHAEASGRIRIHRMMGDRDAEWIEGQVWGLKFRF